MATALLLTLGAAAAMTFALVVFVEWTDPRP